MEILRYLSKCASSSRSLVSLGNFDGVHLGHQTILRRLVQEARERQGTAIVFTFYPHPLAVLRPKQRPPLICNLREKLRLFASLGVQKVFLQRFTQDFAQISPEEFVRQYIVEAFSAEKVIVGHNVSFGQNRAGRAETLQQLGKAYGFETEIIGPIKMDAQDVSSTLVRTLLSSGSVSAAGHFLGRRFTVNGCVVKGFQRGRTVGFPTANLFPRADLLLPNGVYAVIVELDGREIPGVANIGFNPTFGVERRTLEAHLFDFSDDLYGKRLSVGFVEKLRGEQKFASVEELVHQIQKDVAHARSLLAASST